MRKLLLGGIAGDIIGSIYEFNPVRFKDFELFKSNSTYTDDTVMTIANAEWLLSKGVLMDIMRKYGHKYPGVNRTPKVLCLTFGVRFIALRGFVSSFVTRFFHVLL